MSEQGMFGAQGTGDTSGYGGLARTAASTGSSERPYGSYFDEVADDLERAYPMFSDAIERVVLIAVNYPFKRRLKLSFRFQTN